MRTGSARAAVKTAVSRSGKRNDERSAQIARRRGQVLGGSDLTGSPPWVMRWSGQYKTWQGLVAIGCRYPIGTTKRPVAPPPAPNDPMSGPTPLAHSLRQ